MKKKLYYFITILLGALLSYGTKFLFTACCHADGSLGKCNYSQGQLMYVGTAIMVVAIFGLCMKKKVQKLIAALMTGGLWIFSILIPNVITGVCKMETMTCRIRMLPAVMVISIAGLIVAAFHLWSIIREK